MMGDKGKTARQIVESLIAEDGWKGFYRGLGPRFFSMSAWGTSMILAYEYLSMDFISLSVVFLNTFPLHHLSDWMLFCKI